MEAPANLGCDLKRVPYHLLRTGRVTLQLVLDEAGHLDARSIRFLDAPDLLDDISALIVLGTCKYRPARVDGKAVRVLIEQPVDFKVR